MHFSYASTSERRRGVVDLVTGGKGCTLLGSKGVLQTRYQTYSEWIVMIMNLAAGYSMITRGYYELRNTVAFVPEQLDTSKWVVSVTKDEQCGKVLISK